MKSNISLNNYINRNIKLWIYGKKYWKYDKMDQAQVKLEDVLIHYIIANMLEKDAQDPQYDLCDGITVTVQHENDYEREYEIDNDIMTAGLKNLYDHCEDEILQTIDYLYQTKTVIRIKKFYNNLTTGRELTVQLNNGWVKDNYSVTLF